MVALSSQVGPLLRSPQFRWAVSGWAFFIAENAILSENRTFLISELGDDRYHLLYGTFSTAAMGSIAYSYYYLTKKAPPAVTKGVTKSISVGSLTSAWASTTLGFIMASQALPKMQVPVSSSLQVRCPFDFTDKREPDAKLYGLERITRHPGLWSMAFVFAGNAFLQTSLPLQLWWMGPTAIAWLGGMHSDSRFRRGMGGTLDPHYDSVTSNVPFVAMLTGRQGAIGKAANDLFQEIKPLNAAMAATAATFWIMSRGRVRMA